MIHIRPADAYDVAFLVDELRQEDVREVEAATGRSPREIVPLSFQLSRQCYVVQQVSDGMPEPPCAIFGVTDGPQGEGVVWMLCTDQIRHCRLDVLRRAPSWLARLSRNYRALVALADERNELHVRWCKHAGFVKIETVEHNNHTFAYLVRPNDHV